MSTNLFFKRKITGIFLLMILLYSIFASSFSTRAIEQDYTMDFDCESLILMEATTGTILYEKNSTKALPPASVTKIMTLLIIMEEIEKGTLKYTDMISTSEYAASMGGSQIYLKEGELMSAEDMIKSVVIASANDAAVALAEHISGSEDAFVKRMNEKAKELGMKNTNFENTNGLDDTTTNHLTSALDIAIMSKALLKHKDILKYSSIWMDTIRNGEFGLTNTNRLVRFYQGATGLKTGSTNKAKFCISATAERNGMHLICVIMGAPTSDVRNKIATKLLDWGFANYELYHSEKEDLSPLRVKGGTEQWCQITAAPFSVVVKKGDAAKIQKKYILDDFIFASVTKGQKVGEIKYTINGTNIGNSDITSSVTINEIDYWSLFIRILSKFLLK